MEAQLAAEHAGDMRPWGEKPSANQILSFHWIECEVGVKAHQLTSKNRGSR